MYLYSRTTIHKLDYAYVSGQKRATFVWAIRGRSLFVANVEYVQSCNQCHINFLNRLS